MLDLLFTIKAINNDLTFEDTCKIYSQMLMFQKHREGIIIDFFKK